MNCLARYTVYLLSVGLSLLVFWVLGPVGSVLLVLGTWGWLLVEGRRSW